MELHDLIEIPKSPRQVKEITTLYSITTALASSMDMREALEKVVNILSEEMEFERGTITIINPSTQEIKIEVAHGLSAEARKRGRYKIGEGITGKVVASGEPIIVPRMSDEPSFLNRTRSRGSSRRKELSFICVPIKVGPKIIGTLSVDRPASQETTLEQDLRFLTIASGLIAQTVNNILAIQEEKERLINENIRLKLELQEKYRVSQIIGRSSRMQEVFEMIHRVAKTNATVLLRGESGTGKSLVARAVHYNSPRAKMPFVTVTCAALPETLLESELFGHEKGTFTGATSRKIGLFEKAQGGTVFLDEVGEISPAVQTRLLHVIQEREFFRVGGTTPIKCDVRIIAATNKDIEKAMSSGAFREDLYYRLNVFPIYLPPLRERKTDILLLAEYFLEKYAKQNNKEIIRISTPAIDLLMQYHWPGNVRELENVIERAVVVCDDKVIRGNHLPPTLQSGPSSQTRAVRSLSQAVENLERELIIEALKETKGNQSKAAKLLDTSLRILNYKIKKYAINPKLYKWR